MTGMQQIAALMLTLWFIAIGLFFWFLVSDERGLIIWLVFGFGAFSLGRRYERDHATASQQEPAALPALDD
jgi:positive regulator of sigma E activity